jgi:hypothetical protein
MLFFRLLVLLLLPSCGICGIEKAVRPKLEVNAIYRASVFYKHSGDTIICI